MSYNWITSLGLILIFTGFAVIFAAVAIAIFSRDRVRGGGVILIGPFPIIFGSNAKMAKSLIYLAVILLAFFMVLSFLLPFILSGTKAFGGL